MCVLRPKPCTQNILMKVSHLSNLLLCSPLALEFRRREIAEC